MKSLFLICVFLLGCTGKGEKDFLGAGSVEMKIYQVAPSVAGSVTAMGREEGQAVEAGVEIALIDTVPFALTLKEVRAGLAQAGRQCEARSAEIEALKNDIAAMKRERDRIKGLVDKGSAPAQQYDNLESQYQSGLLKQKASELGLMSLISQKEVMKAREDQVLNQLERCHVKSPCRGTVLVRYRNAGEMAGPSAPLYELGASDTIQVDVFVPQPLLSGLALGQEVRIRLDSGNDKKGEFVAARVGWISNSAEFSPKNIQTRESRNGLFFRARVLAANKDGILKRGMPVEVFSQAGD